MTRYRPSPMVNSSSTSMSDWPEWTRSSALLALALPHRAQVMASSSADFPLPLSPQMQAMWIPSRTRGSGGSR
ncbi:MAG: hypothetical protein IIC81_09360 [Chloroflexi bacterium]|nr:hypothetical protein [Chloroflexota bacterium]